MIKTQDGEKSVSSTGLAGAALGLAIPGTVALVNQLAGGRGLFNTAAGAGCNTAVNMAAAGEVVDDTRIIGALASELAKEKSERYADMIGINTFKEAKTMFEKAQEQENANCQSIYQMLSALDKQVAVDKQKTNDNFSYLDSKIDNTATRIYEYVNGTFVPGKLIMPSTSICPQPLAACTPLSVAPQVLTSTTATVEGEVNLRK